MFQVQYNKIVDGGSNPCPGFWKGIGDELVFQVELHTSQHAIDCVKAFQQAVKKYEPILRTDTRNALGIKASGWVADFPVFNCEIPVEGKEDFIGQHIDTGFRISKHATRRKFIISVELTVVLIKNRALENEFKYYFEERKSLKGVLDQTPYPIIWIDMEPDDERFEREALNNINNHTDPEKLLKFCEFFIDSNSERVLHPILLHDPLFQEIPDWYRIKLNNARDAIDEMNDSDFNDGDESLDIIEDSSVSEKELLDKLPQIE